MNRVILRESRCINDITDGLICTLTRERRTTIGGQHRLIMILNGPKRAAATCPVMAVSRHVTRL